MKKEQKLKEQATLALAEKNKIVASSISKLGQSERSYDPGEIAGLGVGSKRKDREAEEMEQAVREREELRKQRKKEIERERRMQVAKKKDKATRDDERDISEKIALG